MAYVCITHAPVCPVHYPVGRLPCGHGVHTDGNNLSQIQRKCVKRSFTPTLVHKGNTMLSLEASTAVQAPALYNGTGAGHLLRRRNPCIALATAA